MSLILIYFLKKKLIWVDLFLFQFTCVKKKTILQNYSSKVCTAYRKYLLIQNQNAKSRTISAKIAIRTRTSSKFSRNR